MGQQRYGKGGEDATIVVPVGTEVINVATDEVIGDMTRHGDRMLVAKGGKGGLGNMHFKSSTNRSPRQFTPGEEGEERLLRLELKLLADVGLLGFPNAGKSRSEEHTSELQSLMSISYAVFCLKKKQTKT